MRVFMVFDNGREARYPIVVTKEVDRWKNCVFSTFDLAESYALAWLGNYAPEKGTLKLAHPYDYNGYGDTITIREYEIGKECI